MREEEFHAGFVAPIRAVVKGIVAVVVRQRPVCVELGKKEAHGLGLVGFSCRHQHRFARVVLAIDEAREASFVALFFRVAQ